MLLTLAQSDGVLAPQLWDGLRHDWRALVWLGLLQVATLLAFWLAARVLVPRREMNSFGQYDRREGAGFGHALLLYLGYAVLAALCLYVLRKTPLSFKLALLDLVSAPRELGAKWIAIFAGLGLLLAIFKFGLPMAIFRIRLPRAIVLLIFSGLIIVAAGWGLDLALGRPVEQRLVTINEWAARKSGHGSVLKSIAAQAEEEVVFAAAEHVAADPAKPMPERKEAVRNLYNQLGEIRRSLPPGDSAALADYEKKHARYEALLKQLRAELAEHPEAAE